MSRPPAIVVLAADGGAAVSWQRALAIAGDLRWPLVVVVAPEQADAASAWLATRDLAVLSPAEARAGPGAAVAAGVAARADANGWVLLPARVSAVRPSTVRAVGLALGEHPVAYAQHGGRQGYPVGCSAELLHDLLASAHDGGDPLRRVLARYPAAGVEVDDPGALAAGGADAVRPGTADAT